MIKQLTLLLAILLVTILAVGCEKETTTTSSEYREIVGQSGTDTLYLTDTVFVNQNGTIVYDTTYIVDTVIQNNSTTDTVIQYITQIDTVYAQGGSAPSVHTAFTAMQAYTDQVVIDDITATVGYTDGWVFYLSAYQSYVDNPATNVWDLGGYIDFWAPDFSDFYAYEYGWRMTFVSGDPNDPNNWNISEIPSAVSNQPHGIQKVDKSEIRPSLK